MKTVKIDGVTLTADQVERAYKEIHVPDLPHLTRVKHIYDVTRGVVIKGEAQRQFTERRGAVRGSVSVVRNVGDIFTYEDDAELLRFWTKD